MNLNLTIKEVNNGYVVTDHAVPYYVIAPQYVAFTVAELGQLVADLASEANKEAGAAGTANV